MGAGVRDAKSAAIAGDIEAKYVDAKNGVTLTQAWTTSNVLKTQVELENQIAKGLKLDVQGHLLPATQGKSAYVTAIYKQPSLHTRALLDVFKGPTFTVTLHGLANLSVFSASYYHKVSKDVEAGAKAIYDAKTAGSQVGLEVGTKAYLDNTAFVKAKVNNAGVLGLGYTQALRPGLKLSFGLAVDTKAFSSSEVAASAAHKVGSALTFEA